MIEEKGQVSVTTENIFPIIRQWLYSDRDIFLRELVSNAIDANAKMRRLATIGETELAEDETFRVWVVHDPSAGTLTIEDNGIGMTADEVRKYINQIAFSGVVDFVERYQEKGVETDGIIGHFGLGFYSAFMVSDQVRIDTRSWQPEAEAVSWVSDDGMTYTLGASDRSDRGTLITLALSEEGKAFLKDGKVREILEKYCAFLPDPIYLTVIGEKTTESDQRLKEDEEADSDHPSQPEPVNQTEPLWLKNPRDCTDDEYKDFYRKLFRDYRDPLFWVHLNLDYPFRLKGILYFPRTENTYESLEGRIKIYYNQVFVADNVKEIVPEFLFLLKGALDCPDLPLNVSRSFLQNDAYVNKLAAHIVRKVADRLTQQFKDERSAYEQYWSDIGAFVKYGMMRDEKFYDRVKDIAIFQTVDDKYLAWPELNEPLLYTPDARQQVAYVEMAKARGWTVLVLDHEIDNHFMSFLEFKNPGKRFRRVDAELSGAEDQSRAEALAGLFRKAANQEKLEVKAIDLGADALPALIQESEEARRMQEMRRQFEQMQTGTKDSPDASLDDLFPRQLTLVLNSGHPLMTRLSGLQEIPGREAEADLLASQIYDLARLGHGSLAAAELNTFLKRSADLLGKMQSDVK